MLSSRNVHRLLHPSAKFGQLWKKTDIHNYDDSIDIRSGCHSVHFEHPSPVFVHDCARNDVLWQKYCGSKLRHRVPARGNEAVCCESLLVCWTQLNHPLVILLSKTWQKLVPSIGSLLCCRHNCNVRYNIHFAWVTTLSIQQTKIWSSQIKSKFHCKFQWKAKTATFPIWQRNWNWRIKREKKTQSVSATYREIRKKWSRHQIWSRWNLQ